MTQSLLTIGTIGRIGTIWAIGTIGAIGTSGLVGCDGMLPPGPDLAAPLDGGVGDGAVIVTRPDLSLENAMCEAQLAADWAAHPPTTGLGPAKSATSYESVIGKLMADFGVPGGAVAVTQNGRLVLAKGFGFSDVENQQPAHPDQLFRIASLSKQLTAETILRLVAAGKLSLDEPAFPIIADLKPLPGKTINPDLQKITIRNLLNHTGGWNRDFEAVHDPMFDSVAISAALGQRGPASCQDTIRYMLDKTTTYAPGSTYCYSNFGYCVLGRVIERRAGQGGNYDDIVRSLVLTPALATRARLGRALLADRADDEVRYYGYPGEGLASSIFPSMPGQVPWEYGGWNIEAMDAHGGWIVSPVDMLRTQLAVDGLPSPADVVDASALSQMLANPNVPSCDTKGGTTPADPAYWYGFGWSVNKYGNHWHTGSLDGTSTEDVTASNGFSWAAFFNTRPQDGAFYNQLDAQLWVALQGASGWSATDDYFDQYVAGFSEWMAPPTFDVMVAKYHSSKGEYPVRIEGRLDPVAGVQIRAEWPRQDRVGQGQFAYGQDCLHYRAQDAKAKAAGASPVSIQSFTDEHGRKVFQASWTQYP